MNTATLEPTRVLDHAAARAELSCLLDRQLDAGAMAAECGPDDFARRPDLDQIIALLCTEAYTAAAMLTGSTPVATAPNIPPVVRQRELASAHRALVAAVSQVCRSGSPTDDVMESMSRSASRVRLLRTRLADAVTRSQR